MTTQFPYVSFVESNLKGGIRCALGPKTFIVGRNGSGKSSVLNATELSTTGRVSDMVGRREVAREIDLAALAPGRKGELMARAVLSTGGECVWRAGGKTKKAKHTYPEALVDPDTALALRPVYAALLGSVETAREFFIRYAVGAIADADVLKRIPESLHTYYRNATLATSLSTSSAVDRLLAAMEAAKKSAKQAKDRAKAAAGISDDNASGLPPLPTEAEEAALRKTYNEAATTLDAMKRNRAMSDAMGGLQAEEANLRQQLAEAEAAYINAKQASADAEATLAAMPRPEAADSTVQALRQVIAAHAQDSKLSCLCCGRGGFVSTPGQDIQPVVDWDARLTWLDSHLANTAAAVSAYEAAVGARNSAKMRETMCFDEGKRLWERYSVVQTALGTTPEAVTPEAIAAQSDAVKALDDKLRAIDVLKASWATVSKSKDAVLEAQTDAETWSKLADACAEAVLSLLDGGVAGFIAKVQANLPASDKYALTLRDGDRAVFQYGLMKHGILHTALCGAEWARVTAAMAGACIANPRKLAVVIPEDRAYDATTLTGVLQAFTSMPAQVLLASPVMPTEVPPGWTVINTDNDEHRGFEAPALPSEG